MKNVFWRSVSGPARRGRSLLLALLLASGFTGLLEAAPFDRVIGFTQPDGTPIQLHGKGDEFAAVFETLDGYTVVFDPAQRAYCYAQQAADGTLVSNGTQVHLGNPAALGFAKGVRMSPEARKKQVVARWQRWEQGMQIQRRWEAQKMAARTFYSQQKDGQFSPPTFTTVGLKVGLTLLIDFSDDPETIPQADIISYLNADNYTGYGNNGSVKSYFYDTSGGQLTYTNVVTIYVRAPNPKTTYNVVNQDAVQNANTLIKDALDTLKNLANYTTEILPTFEALTVNANNEVIAFNVFYAGDNGGVWAGGLWPHSAALAYVGAQELSAGGKKVYRYQITNIGNSLTLGTFCHENGHMLCGYPDIYDYDYDSVGGAGMFCLMNSGGDGGNPVQICAYLKRASGWGTTTDLDEDSSLQGTVTATAGTNFNHFYRYQKPGVATEYYLVENRQATGRDANLPASGIAIWHVDELGDRDNQSTAYNTSHANYECSLVQADNQYHFQRGINQGDSRDLYYAGNPAVGYANLFSDVTAPSARWWDGSMSGFQLADFSESGETMTFRVGSGLPYVNLHSTVVSGGNGNGIIDFNECNELTVVLTNAGMVDVSGITMTLSTATRGVAIMQAKGELPLLAAGTMGSNTPPFRVSTGEDFVCGTPIDFILVIKADQASLTNQFRIETGEMGTMTSLDGFAPIVIPSGTTNGALSPVFVSGVDGALGKVTVSLHITHTYDSDLQLELVAPDGTVCRLASNVGSNGRNFGVACTPESNRTIFDDSATNAISAGRAPFVGSFQPEQALATFSGKYGTNVNGIWYLRVVDDQALDFGTLQCWSLHLYPALCTDGGGQCPGNDLAVQVSDFPDPVVIGSNLVYTITVTNTWSKLAKGVVMNQTLPSSVAFVSASSTLGSVNSGGGVVTANLGNLTAGGAATITVTVLPLLAGNIASTATVASAEPDINLADNVVVANTTVLTPSADLAVALSAAPNPTTVNGLLTYTTVVRNNGPASASGVVVSNYLASSMVIMGAGASKGSAITSGNTVLGLIGALTNGETATITISAVPTVAGSLNASARVFGGQEDPVLGNNVVTITTVVGQAADLGITLVDQPDPVVVSSNFTYFVTVTNRGPNTATNVTVSQSLPRASYGYRVVNLTTSQGSRTIQNDNVIWEIGSLAVGANARMTVVGNSTNFGTLTSIATVSAAQADLSTADNSASAATVVAAPFINVVTAGATLTAESITPANGAVDIGETVTVQLRLQNIGNVNNTNLVTTLQASGGVTPITPSQSYGVLPPGGLPESRAFSFMANGTSGGKVTATLRLQDGPNDLPSVGFTFELPDVHTFANATPIDLAHEGAADPYPSAIIVSGLTGLVNTVTVTLSNANHTYPDDLDVLLVGPGGRKVLLMSDAGGNGALLGTTFTFDAAATPLPDDAGIVSARYAPADYEPGDAFASPAPAGPYDTALGVFGGMDPNGEWLLYVMDDAGGDVGNIAGGWLLTLTTVQPVNQVADLELAGTAAPLSGQVGANLVYTFTITNAGPDSAAGVAFTNVVPTGAELVSAEASQGSATASGNLVIGSLGALAVGEIASVTVVVAPASQGLLTNTATIASSETDLNLNNNVASVGTAVGLPVADVGLLKLASPVAVTIGSNVTFVLAFTNHGPETALHAVVRDALPAGLHLVNATTDVGSVASSNGTVIAHLNDLAAGGVANVTVTAMAMTLGAWTNVAVATTGSSDPGTANNTATVVFNIVPPAPTIVPVAAALLQEGNVPANGAVDPGETVTVSLALQNTGAADTANLVATLQASGGVTPTSDAQSYGALLHGGAAVSRPFSFTASGSSGGVIVATLELKDGSQTLAPVTFSFQLPTVATFSSPTAMTIPNQGPAVPYPATIQVAGVSGSVSKLSVTLQGFTHGFPDDVDVLLVGPAGQKLVLMSDAGAGYGVTNLTLTFDDAATATLPDSARLSSASYRPANYEGTDVFPSPAPAGTSGNNLAVFNGTDPNGKWSLYVTDDANGDGGAIVNGWSLSVTAVTPVNPLADIAVTLAAAPDLLYEGDVVTYTLTIPNYGPAKATAVVLTNALPYGLQFVSGSASQGSLTAESNIVTCVVGDLMPGNTTSVEIRAKALFSGTFLNAASVVLSETDPNLANNQAQKITVVQYTAPARFVEPMIVSDHFQTILQGMPGFEYVIQTSADFTAWQSVVTNAASPDGSAKFVDPAAASQSPQKYYRAVRLVP